MTAFGAGRMVSPLLRKTSSFYAIEQRYMSIAVRVHVWVENCVEKVHNKKHDQAYFKFNSYHLYSFGIHSKSLQKGKTGDKAQVKMVKVPWNISPDASTTPHEIHVEIQRLTDLRSSRVASLLYSFCAGSCNVANETERRFLVSHVYWPVREICTNYGIGWGRLNGHQKDKIIGISFLSPLWSSHIQIPQQVSANLAGFSFLCTT